VYESGFRQRETTNKFVSLTLLRLYNTVSVFSIEVFCTFAGKTGRMILIADSGSTKTDWIIWTGDEGCGKVISTQGINPFHQSVDEIELIENNRKEDKNMTTVINVNGMMCEHCKANVEKVTRGVEGVSNSLVNLEAKNVTIEHSADTDLEKVKKAITDAGYEVV